MLLDRVASGLVFLSGVGLSRLGIRWESWPVLAVGLLAATLGFWHFFMRGTATAITDGLRRDADGPARPQQGAAPDSRGRQAAAHAPSDR